MIERREDEGMTEFTIRRIRHEIIEQCAQVAENYSNAKPGDICEVMAGDWQAGIAKAIRGLGQTPS